MPTDKLKIKAIFILISFDCHSRASGSLKFGRTKSFSAFSHSRASGNLFQLSRDSLQEFCWGKDKTKHVGMIELTGMMNEQENSN